MAAGKPILSTITMGYDLITKYNVGVSLSNQTAESIGNAIIEFSEMSKEQYEKMGSNARELAKEYDFEKLTGALIDVIEKI